MAEVTALRDNVFDFPIYGMPYTVVFPLLDADGDPVDGATCDSEISKNGDTSVDCVNEGTHIPETTLANAGLYYLTLTHEEMTAGVVGIVVASATSKATCLTLYPRNLPVIATGQSTAGANTTITLAAGSSTVNDYYNGCVIYLTADTGHPQVRLITDYDGSTLIATVHVEWATNPDDTTDYSISLSEISLLRYANTIAIGGTVQTANDIGADVNEILTDTGVIGALGAGLTAITDKTDLISADSVSANPAYMHNPLIDQNNIVVAQVGLVRSKPSAAPIQIVEITDAGLIKVWRYRKGTDSDWTIIVNGGGMGVGIGGVYYQYTFPAASWANGDLILYEIYNIEVTLGTEVFTLSTVQGFGIIGDTTYTAAIKTSVDNITQILTGNWEIVNNQLKIYASDGTTVLYTFNLTQDGTATEFNPDKRTRV